MLQAMFVIKIKIAAAITVMTLTCSGVCLTGYSSMQAGQSAPIQAPPPRDYDAKLPEMDAGNEDAKKLGENENAGKMFPGGLEHDFGKVQSGTQAKHAFRVVNTSNVTLRIVSLRGG
jgi:hypothetical protein